MIIVLIFLKKFLKYKYRWLAVGIETLGNLVVLVTGFFAVLNRESLDAGTVGLTVSCAIQVTRTLNYFIRKTADVETSSVSIERLKEFSQTQQVRIY